MAYLDPTIADFKSYFVRDFPYGTNPATSILDADIGNAIIETQVNFNPNFWANQAGYTLGFLLFTAHCLVMNLRASSQGISGQYNWTEASKGVGSVNEAFSIPDRINENPEMAMLTKTFYGAKYLSLILPQLTGQIFSSCGGTNP